MKFSVMLGLCFLTLYAPAFSQEKKAGDFSWEMIQLDKRISAHDDELTELRHKIDALQLAIKCPCARGGKCICPPLSCLCPNCPEHHGKANDRKPNVVPSGLENQDNKQRTFGVSWKPGQPTMKGVEVAFIGASWCANCPAAEARLGNLKSQIHYIDADKSQLDEHFGVSSFPTAVALMDGMVVSRCPGNSIGTLIVGDWLEKPLSAIPKPSSATDSLRVHLTEEHGYSQSQVAGMSDAQVKAAHDRAHNPPAKRVIVAKPAPVRVYSAPAPRPTYSAPPQAVGRSVTRYGGPTWTWPGNLRQHLETVHGVSTAGLSDSQLRTVHDNLHNARQSGITGGYSQPRVSYARPSFQPRVMFSSFGGGCPNGLCPR